MQDHEQPSLNPLVRPSFHLPVHLLAVAVLCATFPLIFMGGLVTSNGAGMSVPDWPNSYGYNMVLFPPSKWIGGIWYEHVHRLMGTLVGLLCIAFVFQAWGFAQNRLARKFIGMSTFAMALLTGLAILAIFYFKYQGKYTADFAKQWSHVYVGFGALATIGMLALIGKHREPRRWLRWMTVVLLGAIIIQGIMGGERVNEINIYLAMIHGCFAQLCLCFAGFLVLATSQSWTLATDESKQPIGTTGRTALRLGILCFSLIFCQLIVGAIMRHNGAGLAIPDVPFAYGKLLPPTNSEQLNHINAIRAFDWQLPPATLAGVWLHFTHRMGAMIVSSAVLIFVIHNFRKLRHDRAIRRWSYILLVLLATQFTLGVVTVWKQKPADIASLHVATGALFLLSTALCILTLARHYALACRKTNQAGIKKICSDQPGQLVTT